MQKIVPHLWFDKEAKEAAEFYTSFFPDSKINGINVLHDTPSGDCDVVSFDLAGFKFMSISAGPLFKINPSISFFLNFDPSRDKQAREHLDMMWEKLIEGGKALMPLQEYPFSKRYGWVEDRYGVSWQLILTNPEGEKRPFIVPSLMFTKQVCGKAEEAINFYVSVFRDSKRGQTAKYPSGMEPNKEGSQVFADFMLEKQWFAAMDAAGEHKFIFSEAVSLMVYCKDQKEIDYYWEKLSSDPESEQCGWLKDKYGVSWQIVPIAMDKMIASGDEEKVAKLTEAFLKMKKFDVKKLEEAYNS